MSYICSQALVAEFLGANCSDIDASAQLNGSHTLKPSLWHDRTMEVSRLSRYGMTCEPLTESFGGELLTWWLAAFPAKPTPRQLRGKALQMISGRKCDGSWQMSLPGTYLPRTSAKQQLKAQRKTASRWAIKPSALPFPRKTWVATTYGNAIGYLHTPTCAANYSAKSMQKHACARNFTQVFGKPTPTNHEWLMGWPIGWSGIEPLETAKFLQWRQQHGDCSEARK